MRYILNIDPRLNITDPSELMVIPDVVYLIGEINEELAAQVRRDIEIAESAAITNGQTILPLIIDSMGGDVYATLSIIDAIDSCSLTIATIIEGKAMSAAVDIAVCGAEGYRFCGPNATIMMHGVSAGSAGTLVEMETDVREAKRIDLLLLQHLNKRCGKKKGYFEKEFQKLKGAPDWYLTPQEAKKHNIINHVKIPAITVNIGFSYTFE